MITTDEANDAAEKPSSGHHPGGSGRVSLLPLTSDPNRSTGLICLTAVSARYGVRTTADRLAHEHLISGEPEPANLVKVAESLGFKAREAKISYEQLQALGTVFPILARLSNGRYVVVTGTAEGDKSGVVVWDPLTHVSSLLALERQQFTNAWNGIVIYLKRAHDWHDEQQPFGLLWFVPQVLKEKAAFRDVAVAALSLQALALLVPIYFQLVIDKVVTHHSWSTLYVLTVGIVIALAFESILSFLRQYLLLFATTKIDIRLAVRVFAHVLRLPLGLFEHMPTGVMVRHIQQVDRIRQFLTGRVFLTALDGAALFVLVPALLSYSLKLTLVILTIAGLIAATVGVIIPPLRRRLRALYQAEGERQATLVETITGMRTIKSMAIEPVKRKEWDQEAARVIDLNFQIGRLSASAQAVIHLLERLMIVLVVAIGASAVFGQEITIGALVAIQMLAGRVTAPLVQAAALLHDYQEAALSVKMLAEIMNHPAERPLQHSGVRPPLQGRIELDRLTFRYAPTLPPALDRVSLVVAPGAIVGVVGRSGSGKTTLTRLIQGLYPCQEGILRVDGVDIREIDLAYLRRNIGIVLQDNFLFHGTVSNNIAVGRPDAGMNEIVHAARLSGASEFIEKLPQTYDTVLEETGNNLSGGQRQRLAIARALLPQPRILIFDEATSSLDPETEGILLDNLPQITSGRTTIIISHRLSTLVSCNAIVVLEEGRIIDVASHGTLLKRCELYRRLWNQQNRAA